MTDQTTTLAPSDQVSSLLPAGAQLVAFDEKVISSVTQASGFLPRLAVCGSQSTAFQDNKCAMGSFSLTDGEKITDLGNEIDVLLVSVRPKALRITKEAIFENFDVNSDGFKAIQKESGQPDSGCLYGAEFLIWLPEHGFVSYFCGSKTGRREAPNMMVIMKQGGDSFKITAATLRTKLITGGKYKWHGSESSPFTAPFTDVPETEELNDVLGKFNNPPPPKVETVTPDGRAR